MEKEYFNGVYIKFGEEVGLMVWDMDMVNQYRLIRLWKEKSKLMY